MTSAGARQVARPPGPSATSIYASLVRRRDPAAVVAGIAADYPRITHFRLGREHAYLLSDPELVHTVFARHGRDVRKGRLLQKITVLLGDGLLTSEGETHRRQRRLIQPAFHERRIRAYADAMLAAAGEVDRGWRAGERRDVFVDMSGLALDALGRALFGADLRAERAEVTACLQTLLGGMSRNVFPGADRLLALPTRGNAELFGAVRRLDAVVHRLVQDRRAAPPGPDLLSALVHPDAESGAVAEATDMDDQQLRDEVMTLLLAGHETTATALTWAWYLLDSNPAVAAWLHEEVDAHAWPPSYDDLETLPRTHAVLAEAMRLFPPSWLLGRRVVNAFELDEWTLPPGSLVTTSQWVLHRDGRFWDGPERFTPERWLRAERFDESAPGQPRAAYLPFGVGARGCVGEPFAWTEGVLVLATLARNWAPQLPAGHVVRPHASVTLRPKGGMPMVLAGRPSAC